MQKGNKELAEKIEQGEVHSHQELTDDLQMTLYCMDTKSHGHKIRVHSCFDTQGLLSLASPNEGI